MSHVVYTSRKEVTQGDVGCDGDDDVVTRGLVVVTFKMRHSGTPSNQCVSICPAK